MESPSPDLGFVSQPLAPFHGIDPLRPGEPEPIVVNEHLEGTTPSA
jgi:hypothetical protein